MKIPTAVKMFKDRSAELGEPKISVFVAKLDNPTLSFGVRKNIIPINNRLMIKKISFSMLF